MSDDLDVGIGPRLLAIETAIRVLIEQVSLTDPALRDRIAGAVERYLAGVPQLSDFEREFINRARDCVVSIVRRSDP